MTKLDNIRFEWEPVGAVSPHELVNARELIHHSIQLIAAAGKYLIPLRPDDSHTSMHWNEIERGFEGEAIGKMPSCHVGLHPADMTLYIKQYNKNDQHIYHMQDNTLDSALVWLKSELNTGGIDTSEINLNMHYEILPHAVVEGKAIRIEHTGHFKEIERYFSNANNVLKNIETILPDSGDIRCWPHHFDIATLLTIDKDKSAVNTRSIGIGLSPGDGSHEEPYFYITPWPYPDLLKTKLPELVSGKWHTEGWVGAILLGSEIISSSDQTKTVSDFIKAGISACAGLLNYNL